MIVFPILNATLSIILLYPEEGIEFQKKIM